MTLNYVTTVIRNSDSSIVKIKEINLIETENSIMEKNLIEPENSIKEINLCEISTTLEEEEEEEDNNDNQYLEFKTIDDTRKFNYDTNYCNCNALVTYSNRQHWKINNKLKCFLKKFCFINLLK